METDHENAHHEYEILDKYSGRECEEVAQVHLTKCPVYGVPTIHTKT